MNKKKTEVRRQKSEGRLRPERGAKPPSARARGWGPARPEKSERLRPERGAKPPSERARAESSGPQRLQKVLSAAGIASRRLSEELISQGRVSVNGQTVTTLGSKADPASDD